MKNFISSLSLVLDVIILLSIDKHILSKKGQNQILKKGRGAYYSSGSRPNQSSSSWAYARLASVITGGKARKVDNKIWLNEKR